MEALDNGSAGRWKLWIVWTVEALGNGSVLRELWTMKALDHLDRGGSEQWKLCTVKELDRGNTGPWKPWTVNILDHGSSGPWRPWIVWSMEALSNGNPGP